MQVRESRDTGRQRARRQEERPATGRGAQQGTKEEAGNTAGIKGRDEEGERMRNRRLCDPRALGAELGAVEGEQSHLRRAL